MLATTRKHADILHNADIKTLKAQLDALEQGSPELHAAFHAIALLITRHSLRLGSAPHAQIVEYGTKLGELVLSAANSAMPTPGLAKHLAEQINSAALFREIGSYVHHLGGVDPKLIDTTQYE